jgi:integrase
VCARIGEVLALNWEDVSEAELLLLETKNGKSRRLPRSPGIDAGRRDDQF